MIRKALLVILLVAPPMVTAVVTRMTAYPKRFAEVEPGAIYRGAKPTPDQIQRLREEKHVRTVLSLLDEKGTPADQARAKAVHDAGMRLRNIAMPGDGLADFGALDRAADMMNQPGDRPIFFHCAAGKQRSNAVLAAYRLRHCGWTIDMALTELEEKYDLEREGKEQELVEHLTKYAKWLQADSSRQASRSNDPAGPRRGEARQE